MVTPLVYLATEDALSEAVGTQLLQGAKKPLTIAAKFRKRGAGYLRSKMDSWCELARTSPVIVITDLDRLPCPSVLISQWLDVRSRPDNLVLRVAVREIESWLLADHPAMQALLGVNTRLPTDPDTLPDPKSHLLKLARNASRAVRQDLLPAKGVIATQGLGYNTRLCSVVADLWNIDRAATNSGSLQRARARIDALSLRLHSK